MDAEDIESLSNLRYWKGLVIDDERRYALHHYEDLSYLEDEEVITGMAQLEEALQGVYDEHH